MYDIRHKLTQRNLSEIAFGIFLASEEMKHMGTLLSTAFPLNVNITALTMFGSTLCMSAVVFTYEKRTKKHQTQLTVTDERKSHCLHEANLTKYQPDHRQSY